MTSGITYTLEIDWNKDDSFTDESSYLVEFHIQRGRRTLISGDSLTGLEPGTATFILENINNRYDPFNMDSPLYGYIIPDRPVTFEITYSGVPFTKSLFTGSIKTILAQKGKNEVTIECVDVIEKLNKISGVLYSTTASDIDPALAIMSAGSASGLSLSTVLETGEDVIDFWWYDPEQSIWENMESIASAFFGDVFVAGDGTLNYRTRNYSPDTVELITQDLVSNDVNIDMPWNEIRNNIWVEVKPVIDNDTGIIFELTSPVVIEAGDTQSIFADWEHDGEPAIVSSLDSGTWTTSGTGTLGGSIEAGAMNGRINFIETGGANSITVTGGNVKGASKYLGNPYQVKQNDTASEVSYGVAILKLETPWMQNNSIAYDMASYFLSTLKNARKTPTFTLMARPEIQYSLDLFDVAELYMEYMQITGRYKLTFLSYDWKAKEECITTWRFEPTVGSLIGQWLLGTSKLGSETYLV